MAGRFLQIHTLTHYPASLLNRDDAGFAKRMPLGGAVRTRISSQCLKRHWRVFDGDHSLSRIAAPESVRSRVAFERFIVEPLVAEGVTVELARAAAGKIIGKVFGGEAKQERQERAGAKKGRQNTEAVTSGTEAKTAQVTVLGRPELEYLCQLAREAAREADGDASRVGKVLEERMNEKELKKNIQALRPGSLEAGLGAALFGRMVTGDILARTDAAIHVAHAMTVHAQQTESDYFTAIDDLVREEGDLGGGHINASELTSGLFYGYVVVDLRGLIANLGDDRPLAGDVVESLIHIVSKVSPGAKLGSTAPYAYSHLVLVEAGAAQPRTLQNAFIEPVRTAGSVLTNTYDALAAHLAALDEMYGRGEDRAHATLDSDDRFENRMTLPDLALWAKARVTG